MESIINTYNNQMIETYAEMFPDIDASIISDLVKNNDDPIIVEAYLIEHNLANQSELDEIKQKVQASVDDAVKFAEESPEPDPKELYRYIFAED